jgi:hypothetical protein
MSVLGLLARNLVLAGLPAGVTGNYQTMSY